MKTKLSMITIGLVLAVLLFIPVVSATGNGAQSGPHFNLNIIGKYNLKNADADVKTATGTHVIFCPLTRNEDVACRIYLTEGDYQVLDGNGIDGVARFQIPDPYADGADLDDATAADARYRIYVRVLGTPGGIGKITAGLCEAAEDVCISDSEGFWLSEEYLPLASHSPSNKESPNQKFVDATHVLTTINVDGHHIGLFETDPFHLGDTLGDTEYAYFWDIVNKDMKVIQMRFYPVATA